MKSTLEQNPTAPANFVAPASFIALEPNSSAVETPQRATLLMSEEDEAVSKGLLVMAVMLTRRCNMACAHCSVESGPKISAQPSDDELLQLVRDAAQIGANVILLTGGEPMLREDLVMRMLAEIRALNMVATLTTNGFWGKNAEVAKQKVQALSRAGIARLTVSYDRYHAEFQGPEPAVNIARAVEELSLPMVLSINLTREAGDDLADLVAPFAGLTQAQMRFYDVQAVGRARDIAPDDLRKECGGFCTAACIPTITDDGRVTACNGPAYFSSNDSPLVVGSLKEHSIGELIERHRADPVLETIRTFGPMRLQRELEQMKAQTPELEVALRDGYSGMCDLCLHLTSQPAAMKALGERLAQPGLVAERFAAQRVMKVAQSGGELDRQFVNTIGACRLFLRAMTTPVKNWEHDAERVWGRADFDWNHQVLHLIRCGLSIPLQNALSERALSRWAPPFFIQKMRAFALTDSLRATLQRQAMRHIAHACQEAGTRGTLLKGSAMMALDAERNNAERNNAERNNAERNAENAAPNVIESKIEYSIGTRSCCDVDVHIPRDRATVVRDALLRVGFRSEVADADEKQSHQLPALTYNGVLVEIHQTLQPDFCGLPEREMLSRAMPLRAAEMQGLWTLDAEGQMLYSAVHLSKHLFAHGLKTAWDFGWIMERFPDLDWARLALWVKKCGMSRGFWIPVLLYSRELQMPFPADFLRHAPNDKRQRKLETIARRHLFGTTHFAYEDNPWICQTLYALMSDSWPHRLRCAYGLAFGGYSRRLRRNRNHQNAANKRNRWLKLRDAARKWRDLS